MAYKVLIADDQNIPRQLFELIISSSERYELLYSLETAAVAPVYCARYKIDLAILDVVMDGGPGGLDAAERIKKESPHTRILIVTSMPEVSFLKRAREIGVDSFWYKEAGDTDLLEVMDRTMAGESVYPDHTPLLYVGSASSEEFTPTELLVLREMTRGRSNKEIADKLVVEVSTVKKHISNMLQKTGLNNRTELAIEARVRGLVIGDL